MKHQLQVSVSKHPAKDGLLQCKRISLRERLITFLFGKKQEMMILIPSDRINEVAINRKGE